MLLYEAVLREGAAGEGTVKGMRKGLRGSPSFDVTRRKEKRCTLYTVSNTRKLRLQHWLDFTRRDATHQTDIIAGLLRACLMSCARCSPMSASSCPEDIAFQACGCSQGLEAREVGQAFREGATERVVKEDPTCDEEQRVGVKARLARREETRKGVWGGVCMPHLLSCSPPCRSPAASQLNSPRMPHSLDCYLPCRAG